MHPRELLMEFFVAENRRDWDRYVAFLHRDIEWTLGGRVVRGRSAYRDAMVASRVLRREVNIQRVTPALWINPGHDPFLATVKGRPIVELKI